MTRPEMLTIPRKTTQLLILAGIILISSAIGIVWATRPRPELPARPPCHHAGIDFDRTLCACGWMHNYCRDCGRQMEPCEPEDGYGPGELPTTDPRTTAFATYLRGQQGEQVIYSRVGRGWEQ